MNAIKPSWTRSPQPFAIRLKPSRAHKASFCAFVTTILTLIVFSPLSPVASIACVTLVITFAWTEWRLLRAQPLQVLCYSPSGIWSVYNGVGRYSGRLGKQCYRSRWLSIIAIENVRGECHYVVVFYDSVDRRSYSLLQIHMRFPA